MTSFPAIAASEEAKIKVIERALSKSAPFHRSKNSVADGLLIEIFVEAAEAVNDPEAELFFVTHNTRDFSQHAGNQRLPHDDLHLLFSSDRRHYASSIIDVINSMDSEILAEYEWERTYDSEPRLLSEILESRLQNR